MKPAILPAILTTGGKELSSQAWPDLHDYSRASRSLLVSHNRRGRRGLIGAAGIGQRHFYHRDDQHESAISAAQYGGAHVSSVTLWPDPTSPAMTSPHRASPAISPEAVSTPALSTRAFCASFRPLPIPQLVGYPADHPADENGESGPQRQIHAHREEHHAFHFDHDHREAHQDSDNHQRPRHVAAHNAFGEHRHQSGLGRGQCGAAEVVGLVENRQREEEDQGGHHDAEQVADLHLGGCAAQNVPHLEILQHLAGHGGRDADHGGDAEHRRDAAGAGDAQGHHQQSRNHQRAEGQSRHGIIGGADHSHQISGDRGEEEAEHNHHQRRHHRAGDDFRAGEIPRAADEEVVQRDHRHEHHAHAREYHLGAQVAVSAVGGGMGSGGFLQIGDGARHACAQLLAHLEQGVGSAHQHSAHRDGAHHGEINCLRQQRPGKRLTARLGSLDAGSQHEGEQGNQQSPRQHAAGKIQRRQAWADDVAYSKARYELFCRELRVLLDFAGASKVLFGTDNPMNSAVVPTKTLIQLLKDLPKKAPAGIAFTKEEIDGILGGNAASLLGLK